MLKHSLYLECASGISGDMTVAALLDLGANYTKLLASLNSLKVDGYSIHVSRVNSYGIDANNFDVILREDIPHESLFDCKHTHEHDQMDEIYAREHTHEHIHDSSSTHIHRNLKDIIAIINSGNLTPHARDLAIHIFEIVAQAEAQAHGKSVDEIHFHEVGAIDSIVDIIATAVCLDDLNIDSVIVCGLQEGSGFVECQHGALPIPVPAVLNIASTYSISLSIHPHLTGEMITPTGIAIVAAIRTSNILPDNFTVKKIGMGAGKRDFGYPNILRAMILEYYDDVENSAKTSMIETNIDNATGEELGFALESLMKAGALDALYIPAFMKKNRPGWLLRVICDTDDLNNMESIIFQNLPTIGVRHFHLERTCLERFTISVVTPYGQIGVKCVKFNGEIIPHPEYEDVKALSLSAHIPYRTVYESALSESKIKLAMLF